MTDETETVPDDLIQNWPTDLQDQLLASVKTLLETSPYLMDMQPLEYSDIVIGGSRVVGGYRLTSDIDAIAYIKNYVPPTLPGRTYFRHRQVTQFLNVKMDVWIKPPEDINLGLFPGHPDAPTEQGWRTPHYSLMTNSLEMIYPEEIEAYYQFMYPMKPGIQSSDRRWDKLIADVKLPF